MGKRLHGMVTLESITARLLKRVRALNEPLSKEMENLQLPWYSIRNADDNDSDETEVLIYDHIGGWFGVDASQFVRELQDIDTSTIKVRINSPGGSVFDGVAIYNALVSHPATINVVVDSVAASIASVIACAGNKVTMMTGAQMMIHEASGIEIGDARMMREFADFLDVQSQNIAEIYAENDRSDNPVDADKWRERMLAETWMLGKEAVTMGLADEVYKKKSTKDDDEDTDASAKTRKGPSADDFMKTRHNLANRGYKYHGRHLAPNPTALSTKDDDIDVDAVIANMQRVLGGK